MDINDKFSVKDQYEILEKMLKKAQEEKAVDLGKSYDIAMESIVDDLIKNAKFEYNDSGGNWEDRHSPSGWEEFWVKSKIIIDPQTKSILSSFWINEGSEIDSDKDFEINLIEELREDNIINKIAEQGKEGSENDIEDETISMQGSVLYIEFRLINKFNSKDIRDRMHSW